MRARENQQEVLELLLNLGRNEPPIRSNTLFLGAMPVPPQCVNQRVIDNVVFLLTFLLLMWLRVSF